MAISRRWPPDTVGTENTDVTLRLKRCTHSNWWVVRLARPEHKDTDRVKEKAIRKEPSRQ